MLIPVISLTRKAHSAQTVTMAALRSWLSVERGSRSNRRRWDAGGHVTMAAHGQLFSHLLLLAAPW
eukprot:3333566-Rhodomonas_salina.1